MRVAENAVERKLHAPSCIFIQAHKMLCSLLATDGPKTSQKAGRSPGPCRILHTGFREYILSAGGCIGARGRAGTLSGLAPPW